MNTIDLNELLWAARRLAGLVRVHRNVIPAVREDVKLAEAILESYADVPDVHPCEQRWTTIRRYTPPFGVEQTVLKVIPGPVNVRLIRIVEPFAVDLDWKQPPVRQTMLLAGQCEGTGIGTRVKKYRQFGAGGFAEPCPPTCHGTTLGRGVQ